MIIGIVGAKNEIHTEYMKNVLEKKGAEVLIIDTVAFPEYVTISFYDKKIYYQHQSIEHIKSFYIRSKFYSLPPYDLEEVKEGKKIELDGWYSNYVAERERQSLLTSCIRTLSLQGKCVVNPVESFDLHYLKPYQLAILRENGIPVPMTLCTNDASLLLKFKEVVKDVVYKPVAGGASCKKLENRDLEPDRLKLLQYAPVLFQEYIEGENIRVYAIDDKVISSYIIHTDEIDYRGHEKSIEKIELNENVKKMCITAMKLCKMKFTGIDLKRKPNGEYVVLECNPSPMFVGIEKFTGDPISEHLADYLLKFSK